VHAQRHFDAIALIGAQPGGFKIQYDQRFGQHEEFLSMAGHFMDVQATAP
jgi:hypothetical protein